MEPFFLRRWLFLQKSSNIYVGKGSKYTSAAVSISCIVIKNVKISHTNTNLFNDFSGNTLYVNIPDSLQLTKTNQFENTFTYQKRLYTKHFCNIFPTKTHLFLTRSFSLCEKKVRLVFIKIIVDHISSIISWMRHWILIDLLVFQVIKVWLVCLNLKSQSTLSSKIKIC